MLNLVGGLQEQVLYWNGGGVAEQATGSSRHGPDRSDHLRWHTGASIHGRISAIIGQITHGVSDWLHGVGIISGGFAIPLSRKVPEMLPSRGWKNPQIDEWLRRRGQKISMLSRIRNWN